MGHVSRPSSSIQSSDLTMFLKRYGRQISQCGYHRYRLRFASFGQMFASSRSNWDSGTDLSPIQAEVKPPNVHFEVDDCVSEWTYPKDHFDMVHIRVLMGSISDWPALYRQCFECVTPPFQSRLHDCHFLSRRSTTCALPTILDYPRLIR